MIRIHPSWHEALRRRVRSPYFSALTDFVRAEYAAGTCYPPAGEIFAAFDRCPFPDVKVVLLGQDPYHGAGQAEGLCFSVRDGVPPPPSLQNIFKELHTDLAHPSPLPAVCADGPTKVCSCSTPPSPCAPEPPDRTKDKAGKPSPMPSFAPSPLVAKGLCSYFGAPMPAARRPHRQCAPLHSHRAASLTAFGLSWLLRFAAFLASQRLFGCAGRNAHPMVIRCSEGESALRQRTLLSRRSLSPTARFVRFFPCSPFSK